jgi:23S rRNA pseudouridine2605 synthase
MLDVGRLIPGSVANNNLSNLFKCKMKNLIRLNKVLARSGVCSRRKADELISSGQVSVNGVTVTELGTMVDPGKDLISVAGRKISVTQADESDFAYVILNKPPQVVSTVSDPQGRKTIMDFVPENLKDKRLFPVGRLDYFSQGLIILTNDGELTHRLTHPSWEHPKIYHLIVREKPDQHALNTMARGMTLRDGQKLAPVKVRILESKPGGTSLELTLIQGINRQIRRMCQDLGLTILKLTRIKHGPVSLGSLGAGQCRELTPGEVGELRESVNR